MTLAEKIVALHQALSTANVPHAFGGALALAWCTGQARATIDIDVNVFLTVDQLEVLLSSLPSEVAVRSKDEQMLRRDGQARLWWDATPVDVFLNVLPFHEEVARQIRWEDFAATRVPFLACRDLAVFKAFFSRTKDWADLEAMQEAGTLDLRYVRGVLIELLGTDDERLVRLSEVGRS